MKKIIALTIAAIMALICLSSCAPAGKTLDQVKKDGKIVIATSPDFPPFENDENGEIVGIEIDIWNIIAEKLDVTLEIKSCDFDSILTGVQAGKYDVGVSGFSITPDRQKNSLFTNTYALCATAIVVKEGSPIKTKADLSGKKVSVQTSTTAEDYTLAQGYNVSSFTGNGDAQLALVQGKVDAWVIDDLTAAEMVADYNSKNEDKLVVLAEPMTTEPYGFAFAKGSQTLVDEINTIVDGLLADGTIAEIFAKYDAPYTAPSAAN